MRLRAFVIVAGLSATVSGVALAPVAGASAPAKRPPACAGKTEKAAITAIERAYDMVLNGARPDHTLDDRLAFVEGSDDPGLRTVLDAIAGDNADAMQRTGVEVVKVACTGKRTADVLFELDVDGERVPGLAPPGSAVVEDRVWKMTQRTVCNLVSLADPTLLERGPCAEVLAKLT